MLRSWSKAHRFGLVKCRDCHLASAPDHQVPANDVGGSFFPLRLSEDALCRLPSGAIITKKRGVCCEVWGAGGLSFQSSLSNILGNIHKHLSEWT